jgi:hypothetical protein
LRPLAGPVCERTVVNVGEAAPGFVIRISYVSPELLFEKPTSPFL